MKFKKITWLSLLTIVALLACKKEEIEVSALPVNSTAADLEKYLTIQKRAQNVPALTTRIFKEDQVLFENHQGESDIEKDITLTKYHVFLLASISKTITTLLQLYDQGKFKLDDNINDYLNFKVVVPDYIKAITFKMLLTHTSGIADGKALDNECYYGKDSPVLLDQFLENHLTVDGDYYNEKQKFHDFGPGSDHEYPIVGNALIDALVEDITGIGFNEYCKKNSFQPLKMNNTFWRLDEITKIIVQPYNYAKRDYDPIGHYTFADYPNGGLRSNVNNRFHFLSVLAQEGTYDGHELLKKETVAMMITPQITSLDATMGLHLFQMDKTNNILGHGGGEQSIAKIMGYNPTTKVGDLIFCNQGEAGLDAVLIEEYKVELTL
ncbi:MAG: CubicO group peptidase (beta-lactamase class C family) [Salibacteraceae bacterium]|jgi:CubicO group peptidase (beta-lactamase class C family)